MIMDILMENSSTLIMKIFVTIGCVFVAISACLTGARPCTRPAGHLDARNGQVPALSWETCKDGKRKMAAQVPIKCFGVLLHQPRRQMPLPGLGV